MNVQGTCSDCQHNAMCKYKESVDDLVKVLNDVVSSGSEISTNIDEHISLTLKCKMYVEMKWVFTDTRTGHQHTIKMKG